jgi:hypothetical protein
MRQKMIQRMMQGPLVRPALFVALIAGLQACMPADLASRNRMLDIPALQPGQLTPAYDAVAMRVTVPEALAVSERDGIYPTTDIVWRGDPLGDRHDQVQALFAEAGAAAISATRPGAPALVEITLERFHGVTEQTRALVGGVYNVAFVMTLTDPETGAVLADPRRVTANLAAPVAHTGSERDMVIRLLADLLARELATIGAV